jgi:hypothetical protein
MFTDTLPNNGRPIASVCFRENMFTESLPSNGCTRHNAYIRTYSLRKYVYILACIVLHIYIRTYANMLTYVRRLSCIHTVVGRLTIIEMTGGYEENKEQPHLE